MIRTFAMYLAAACCAHCHVPAGCNNSCYCMSNEYVPGSYSAHCHVPGSCSTLCYVLVPGKRNNLCYVPCSCSTICYVPCTIFYYCTYLAPTLLVYWHQILQCRSLVSTCALYSTCPSSWHQPLLLYLAAVSSL